MKKHKAWTIVSIVILAIQVAVEAVTAVVVLRLNMLPAPYAAALIGGLVLFALITGLLMFVHRKDKPVSIARRIIAWILAVLVVCGCGVVSKVVSDAARAIDQVTTGEPVTTNTRNMYVFALAEDPAQNLKNAAGYTFAYIEEYDTEYTELALQMIETTLDAPVQTKGYPTGAAVAEALYSGEVGAAILNGISVALLLETEAHGDFTEKVKILHTMALSALKEFMEPTEPVETEPPEIVPDVTNTPFIVYVSGSDTRSSMLDVSRSDVNILIAVNPVTKQVLLLNTPRDYYVPNPAGNGRKDKLTHCGLYGTDCSMKALGDLYGVEVNHYAQINFNGFETLVDAVGGVTVVADHGFSAGEFYFEKGENALNGKEALAFARERYHVSGGDNGRGRNQMKVIKAVLEKATSGRTIIVHYSDILESLSGMFTTSFQQKDISLLVKMQLGDMAKWNIQSFAVSGKGGSAKTYSAPGEYLYVMYPDEKAVAKASELIGKVFAGEILTAEDVATS